MNNSLRKMEIGEKIAKLIVENRDISATNLLVLMLRGKGRVDFPKNPLHLTDEQLMTSVQSLEKELFERDWRYDLAGEIKDRSLDN